MVVIKNHLEPMSSHIIQVAIDVPIDNHFDYRYRTKQDDQKVPQVGQLVEVPFGHRLMIGLVIGVDQPSSVPPERLKEIESCYDNIPCFNKAWLDLCYFAASYYHRTMGEVALAALPKSIRQKKRRSIEKALKALQKDVVPTQEVGVIPALSVAQERAVASITNTNGFETILLYGVTGSGKTEVYLRAIAETLRHSPFAQVLLMVPEINLTPQLEGRIHARFPSEYIVSLHSELAEGQRLRHWLAALMGKARIILGTRLSVMVPAPHLSMIIVDEEHDLSYKQQEGLRYSARDLAVWRANYLKIPVVLGSATPSLESWHHAQTGRYKQVVLPERAVKDAIYPSVSLIDTSSESVVDGLTPSLIKAIRKRIDKKEISLLFLNRRGFAPVIACGNCTWMSTCSRCSAYMVYHKSSRKLRCHHCGLERKVPVACPNCGNLDLQALGQGTQRIEETLGNHFPDARILRIDADSTSRKGTLQESLNRVHRGEVDIVIGTQMIAKGHDFQNLTLVGVLNPDTALFSQDYRAGERLFALLVQVAGRAGRHATQTDANPAQVMIQTRYPTHPLYQAMLKQNYDHYIGQLMDERKIAGFPPFGYQALLVAEAKKLDQAIAFLQMARSQILHCQGIIVSDVVPMAVMRIANVERAQLLLESPSRPLLQATLSSWIPWLKTQKTRVKWTIEVDPMSI